MRKARMDGLREQLVSSLRQRPAERLS